MKGSRGSKGSDARFYPRLTGKGQGVRGARGCSTALNGSCCSWCWSSLYSRMIRKQV